MGFQKMSRPELRKRELPKRESVSKPASGPEILRGELDESEM